MFIIVCDLPSDECAAAKLQRLREGGDAGPWVRFCLRCLRVRGSIDIFRRHFVFMLCWRIASFVICHERPHFCVCSLTFHVAVATLRSGKIGR